VCLEPVAVRTQGLQVGWVIIKAVTVYVVYVQLTDVYWPEVTLFAVLLAVSVMRRTYLHLIHLVDGIATVSTCYWLRLIPHL
jgi:hypothetical protein